MNTLFQSRISFWAFLCTGNKNKQTKYLVILFVLIDNIFNVVAFAFTELFGKQGRRKHLKLFRVLRKTSDLRERKQMKVLEIISPVLVMIILGILCRKWKLLNKNGIDSMKALLPVAIFHALATSDYGAETAKLVGIMFIMLVVSFGIGFLMKPLMTENYRKYLPFMVSVYEGGSMAYPLYTSLCGAENLSQIAVLDIAMPELDGIEAASRIRQMDENCVIIFLTAYSDFQYTRQAIRLRALDYLTKPYDEEELFAVLETAVFQVKKRMEAEKQEAEDRLAGGTPKSCETGAAVPGTGVVKKESDPIQELDADDIPEDSGAMSDKTMREIRDFVSQNYMHDISMQDAANYMRYSDTYFCRLFKQGFGCNFTTYLTRYRMKEAVRLLKNTELSVKEIALKTGYSDSNYFAKVFKRINGVIPSEFRG